MAKKWRDLRSKMPAEVRARVDARVAQTLKDMPLQHLRRAREFSQVQLAAALGIQQSEISKIEHRTDLYLSTLRSYIEAMGGELEIVARFPDGPPVRITQFEEEQDAVTV